MPFGWDDAVTVGLVAGNFIYHRFLEPRPPPPPAQKVEVPRVDSGAPYPLFYGTVRIHSPVLAFLQVPTSQYFQGTDSNDAIFPGAIWKQGNRYIYFAAMYYIVGIPFEDGDTRILSIFIGDTAMQTSQGPGGNSAGTSPVNLNGNGNFEPTTSPCNVFMPDFTNSMLQGQIEYLNGNSTQQLVDYTMSQSLTYAGKWMCEHSSGQPDGFGNNNGHVGFQQVPGYRGFSSVFVFNNNVADSGYEHSHEPIKYFILGSEPRIPQFSFEMRSFSNASFSIDRGIGGTESNPIHIVYDILTGKRGKLQIPASRIDAAAFAAAAERCFGDEDLIGGLGMSRSWEANETAGEMIQEVMRFVDGVFFEDPITGLVTVKLIRPDWTPSKTPLLTPSNTELTESFAAAGWTSIATKVRVTYRNRADKYRQASALAFNLGNALSQAQDRELVLDHPGCCTEKTAQYLAARELAARCRPLMKLQAICDRTFWRVNPGDVVRLTWPRLQLANVPFRVASVNRGLLADGKVTLNLLQEYHFVARQAPPIINLPSITGPKIGV